MRPQDARDLSTLVGQRNAIDAQIRAVAQRVVASLGLPIETPIRGDLDHCVWFVGKDAAPAS